MRNSIIILFLILFTTVALNGCVQQNQPATTSNADGKINIVATIFPQYDFARAIVGDKANLTLLVSPGASVHSFDPSPSDMKKINNADVFIYIGGESDFWVDRVLASEDVSHKKIIRLMDYVDSVEEEIVDGMEVDEEHGHDLGEESHEEEQGHDLREESLEEEPIYDEHIWTSPKNAIKLVNAISDSLCEVDSDNEELYRLNAKKYIDEIQAVDDEIRAIVNSAVRKKIVVADKFPYRYFVEEYGLLYSAAFPACSDQTDASAKTIAYLVDTVENEKIPHVFYAELSNKNVANSISEQTGAGTLLLNSCHNVSKEDFDAGATYVSLMKQNAMNLREGLN